MGPSLELDKYNESGKYSVKGHVHRAFSKIYCTVYSL